MHSAGLRDIFTLTRIPVTVAVTFTALAAMVLKTGAFSAAMIWPVAGIFLLAAGASAFNQYQEWPYDEKMERTKRRPVPSRRISPAEAVRIAMIGIAGGLIILMYESTWICLLLGVANLIWYNGVYTWLKRKTAFAVVPGALTGVIPVMMGWTAMGGDISDPTLLFLSLYIFIWQMPHFWMMMLKYGAEYRKAGFPTLLDIFSEFQIKIIVMVWITASSAVSMMFVYFRMISHIYIASGILAINLLLLILLIQQLFIAKTRKNHLIFISANLYVFSVLVLMILDKYISAL